MMQGAGTTLAQRYRLEDVVGRGGMSTVYRATDQALDRMVAVKILLDALADQDPSYSARFEREARAAAALADSAVVTVYDAGVDAGSHYIVMEYVEGRSLEQVLREGQALELSEALRIAGRVADALAAAHSAGILHRDIKPANVMVTQGGTVKVLDFGIARNLDGTTITQVASVVGTAAYMAPERALGRPGDARADVYSLGCLLYALLTGGPPFSGDISAAVLHQQINSEPLPPSARRDGVPPALDALVLATLAKSPDERPASAAEVRDGLSTLSGQLADPPPTAATAPLTAPTARAAPVGATGAGPRPRKPLAADHRRRAILMALATGVVTLIALALLSSGGNSTSSTTRARRSTTRSVPATTHPAATTQPAVTTALTTTQPEAPKPKPKHEPPPDNGATPPGHGGEPPGQAKKPKH